MTKSVLGDIFAVVQGKSNKETPNKALPPIKATLDVEIPGDVFERYVDFVFNYADTVEYLDWVGIQVVARNKKKGLLIVEPDGPDPEEDRDEYRQAKRTWKAGEPPPNGFHVIDRDVCLKAFCEGVKRYGLAWQDYDRCDGWTYLYVLQMALWNEKRYG